MLPHRGGKARDETNQRRVKSFSYTCHVELVTLGYHLHWSLCLRSLRIECGKNDARETLVFMGEFT